MALTTVMTSLSSAPSCASSGAPPLELAKVRVCNHGSMLRLEHAAGVDTVERNCAVDADMANERRAEAGA